MKSKKEIRELFEINYQEKADKICKDFGMSYIPIIFGKKLKKRELGLYCGDVIKLRDYASVNVLLHELAHHLDRTRFNNRIKGYYKMEMWPKMELSNIDETGQKWYAATGEPVPVYIHIGKSHGKNFKRCLQEIEEYYLKKFGLLIIEFEDY